LSDVKQNKVDKVMIESDKLVVNYKDGSVKFSTKESVKGFSNLLKDSGIDPTTVKFSVLDESLTKTLGDMAGIILPLVLMVRFSFGL